MIDFEEVENLVGGEGDESFLFSGSGSLSGELTAGLGTDELSFAGMNSTPTINVTGTSTDGYSGDASVILTGFHDIDLLTGSTSTSDTLIGSTGDDTFVVYGTDFGTLNGLRFEDFEILDGGGQSDKDTLAGTSALDDFVVDSVNGNLVNGTFAFRDFELLDGGGGADTLHGSAQDDKFELTDGGDGTLDLLAFTNMETYDGAGGNDTLRGTVDDDTFVLDGMGSGSINTASFISIEKLDGGDGEDTLRGRSTSDVFVTTGPNAGTVNGLPFIEIETLDGHDGGDTYVVLLAGVQMIDVSILDTGSMASDLDSVIVIGSAAADVFVIDEQQVMLGIHMVRYDTSLEQVHVFGHAGDDQFMVTQAAYVQFFIYGGGHGTAGDELVYVHNGLTTPIDNLTGEISDPPFQSVIYTTMEWVVFMP